MRILYALKRRFGKPFQQHYVLIRSSSHFFILLLVVLIDPFGFAETTDARSRDTFYQITAPLYPKPEENSTPKEPISVILIDDASLEGGDFNWPPSFAQYDQLLASIAPYVPEAIFFDLLFLDERGSTEGKKAELDNFAETIEIHGKITDQIPIFVMGPDQACAENPDCKPLSVKVLPQIRNAVTDVDRDSPELDMPFIRFTGYGDNYPFFVKTTNKTLFSPAAALLKSICERGSPNCPQEFGRFSNPIEDLIPEVASIRWPDGNSLFNKLEYDKKRPLEKPEDCNTPATTSQEKIGRGFKYLLGAFSERFKDHIPQNCIYHPYLSASRVLQLVELSGKENVKVLSQSPKNSGVVYETPEQAEEKLNIFLNGKTVLIGMALTGVPDEIISPVHGRIPGVFLHAMALDNALSLGAEIQRPADQIFWEADWTDVIEIGGILLLILIRWRMDVRKMALPSSSTWHNYLYFFFAATVCLFVFPAIIAVTFIWFHWTPINWLGLLSLGWAYLLLCFSSTIGSKDKNRKTPT